MMRRKEDEFAPAESLDLASLAMPSEKPPDLGLSPDPGGTVERMERGQAVAAKKYDEMQRALALLKQKGTGERAPALPSGRVRPAPRASVPPLEAVADSLSLLSGRARPAPRTSVPPEEAATGVAPAQPGYAQEGVPPMLARDNRGDVVVPTLMRLGADRVELNRPALPAAAAPRSLAPQARRPGGPTSALASRGAPETPLPEISNPFPDAPEAFADLPPDAPPPASGGAAGDRASAVAAAPRSKPAPAGERPMALPTFLLRAGDQFNVMGTGRKADHSLADSIDADVARRQALFDKNALDADARARNPEAVEALGDKATREEVMAYVNRELARKLEDRRVSADEMRARAALLAATPRPTATKPVDKERRQAELDLLRARTEAALRNPRSAASGLTPYQQAMFDRGMESRIEKLREKEGKVRSLAGTIEELRKILPADDKDLPGRPAMALARAPGPVNAIGGSLADATGAITPREQELARQIAQLSDRAMTEEGLRASGLTLTAQEQDRLKKQFGARLGDDPRVIRQALDTLDQMIAREAQSLKAAYSGDGAWDEYARRNPDVLDPDKLRSRARGAQATAQPAATAAPRPSAAGMTSAELTAGPTPEPGSAGNVGVVPVLPPGPGKPQFKDPVKVVAPDGRSGTIERSRLQAAIAAGWKEASDG